MYRFTKKRWMNTKSIWNTYTFKISVRFLLYDKIENFTGAIVWNLHNAWVQNQIMQWNVWEENINLVHLMWKSFIFLIISRLSTFVTYARFSAEARTARYLCIRWTVFAKGTAKHCCCLNISFVCKMVNPIGWKNFFFSQTNLFENQKLFLQWFE